MQDIDGLPKSPRWTKAEVTVGEGQYQRRHTVRFRNILELICQLIGARRFKDCMKYAPERHWTSQDKKCRIYDEMWSANWWWRMQVSTIYEENVNDCSLTSEVPHSR